MSPEPSQEPIKENLNTSNIIIGARAINDSDSEDEDAGIAGYMPLSQVPADSDPMIEDDEVCLSTCKILTRAFSYCN